MHSRRILIAVLALLAPCAAAAGPPELDSREYKLMLEPERFAGGGRQDAINHFADGMLKPLIAAHVSEAAADDFAQKDFDLDEQRLVRFWDTAACDLDKHGFALRERADLDPGGNASAERELTLKFRTVDLFLAAETKLPAADGAKKPESKFEEDVAPLAVHKGSGAAVVANPPSTRSLYSRSTKQRVKRGDLPGSIADVAELYPTFAASLTASGAAVDAATELGASKEFREFVFESPKFELGEDLKTKFSITLWYEGDKRNPALAEISFKYETVHHGTVPRIVAQRAIDLYRAMQALPWAKPEAPTKTALAGPSACTD